MTGRLGWIVIAVVVLAAGGFWLATNKSTSALNADYQAVFLDDGHTYFGKAQDVGGELVTLREVYYLESSAPLQQGRGAEEVAADLSLIKLGRELHGPEDAMVINRDHILYIEDLKTDSKVVQAIKAYRNQ